MMRKPSKIKKYTGRISNPRMNLMEDESLKIIGKKGIILKGFMTEKERLAKLMEENHHNSNSSEYSIQKDKPRKIEYLF